MWKILHKRVSNDIGIRFQESFRFGTVAAIPPLHRTSSQRAKSLYDSSFAVKGPALWNIIPKHLKSHETLNSFKSNLDIFLKNIPDRPPVSGYILQNNNSLIDWHNTRNL